jgi:formylglycine-generating enzyme required for sulfatase activity/serine/threonine protein kinase
MELLHPTDQTLSSYGLGKLDDHSAQAVNEHLMECSDCRKRVAELSTDSFLQRVRDAQKPSGKSTSGRSQTGGTLSDDGTNTLTSSSGVSLPPGLAAHPDYEIKRELGRGGMGVVYLAHNRMMGRDEVLKVMGQHLMGHPGLLERFIREIHSVAKLRHPNIVTAYHATRFGESLLLAMEYVEGLDLSRMVETKGPMPVAHACLFIHQAALGLQHAHEEGLIHRDIKPHNLMLSRKGDKATVKILDFGLAKAAREKLAGDIESSRALTGAGQALGTPTYMAPEQIMDASTADIRADIYSLGGTLYYLLTGRPPFQAKSLYDLYQAHISRIADPLNQVRPDVPAELAALVAKMLAKDPAERFQTPGEVAQALKPFCTKANAALTGPAKVGPFSAETALATTQMETDADRRMVRTGKAAEPSGAESGWESMIDFQETDGSAESASDRAPTQRSPWMWSLFAVGVLSFGLFAAWMGGVFRLKTAEGVIVLENVPKDSEILVDGNRITFTWPSGGKPVEIRAVPGQHRVEVSKEGFKRFGQDVTIKADGLEEVTVRLEPLVVNRLEPKSADTPTSNKDVNEIHRLANPDIIVAKEIFNSIGMKFVLVPAGEFWMGSPDSDQGAEADEKPQHKVQITRPFYLGVSEVTKGQYRAVTGESPSYFRGSDDLPVEMISWKDATAFCDKLSEREGLKPYYRSRAGTGSVGASYRLPTEAEWEYACRAGSTAKFDFGDDEASLGECAWFAGNSDNKTHPVGQKRQNAFGLYDMHGNVWEWCSDWYEADYYKKTSGADPLNLSQPAVRVIRGGGWSDDPRDCRSTNRSGVAPEVWDFNLGFRLARVSSSR